MINAKYWLLFMMLLLVGCSSENPQISDSEPQTPATPNNSDESGDTIPDTPASVIYKTFKGHVMCGYQGWFTADGDWVNKGWQHLYANGVSKFEPGFCSIEYWPDMSEYVKTYPTSFKYPDGTTATFFSSADYETADLHFKWMQQYGIDGAIIQRFKSTITGRPWMTEVIANAIKAAEKYGRAIMIEYDLSGLEKDENLQYIIDDWEMLNSRFHFTDPEKCPNYMWEKGRPLVGFFGVSLNNGKDSTPDQYLELMNKLVGRNNVPGELSYLVGCGYYWLTSGNDSKPFTGQWEKVFKRATVISPWAVGRYSTLDYFRQKESIVRTDIAWCKEFNKIYAPVAYPGFSWRNTQTVFDDAGIILPNNDSYDAIPRLKGDFFWSQLASYKEWGCDGVYVAMFDEIDEGTAIFKCSHKNYTPNNVSSVNPNGKFLSYDDDLDSGYYLFLAGEAAKWFRGASGYTMERPVYHFEN